MGTLMWTGLAWTLVVGTVDVARLQSQLSDLRAQPASVANLAEQARLLYLLAEAAGGSERARLHEQGLKAAQSALEVDPRSPAALLWWVAHRGAQASLLNPVLALKIATEVESALLTLKAVAPDYEHAAADRVLGRLYQLAPPIISIGSMEKAGQHLREALERAPTFPGNQLYYAQYLLRAHACRQASRYARSVLKNPELQRYPADVQGWTQEASDIVTGTERRCGRALNEVPL